MVKNENGKNIDVFIDLYRKSDSKERINSIKPSESIYIKYGSLVALTFQNCSLNLLMRMSRTQKDLYISSTAVFIGELIKLITCIGVIFLKEGKQRFERMTLF